MNLWVYSRVRVSCVFINFRVNTNAKKFSCEREKSYQKITSETSETDPLPVIREIRKAIKKNSFLVFLCEIDRRIQIDEIFAYFSYLLFYFRTKNIIKLNSYQFYRILH